MPGRRTLLIPALLDDWFPLLQHAFASDAWEPVLLTEDKLPPAIPEKDCVLPNAFF